MSSKNVNLGHLYDSIEKRAAFVVISFVIALQLHPPTAAAQVSCNWQTLHSDGGGGCIVLAKSSPNQGVWAWNPGSFGGIPGDTHLWNSWRWTTQARLTEFHERDGGVFEHEFWNVGQECDCNHQVLQLRTIDAINPPPSAAYAIEIKKGCGSVDAQLDLVFGDGAWATLNTQYDVSVDANKINNGDGEVNMTWEEDPPLPNVCDRWLGKIEYHNRNSLSKMDPQGICCSTSNMVECDQAPCQ